MAMVHTAFSGRYRTGFIARLIPKIPFLDYEECHGGIIWPVRRYRDECAPDMSTDTLKGL